MTLYTVLNMQLNINIIRLNRFPDGREVPGGAITRERTHALANRPDLRFNYKPYDLTQEQIDQFNDYWTKTDVASIEQTQNGKFRLKLTSPNWAS